MAFYMLLVFKTELYSIEKYFFLLEYNQASIMYSTDPGEVTALCFNRYTLRWRACSGLCWSGRGWWDECSICGFSESQFKVLLLSWMSVIFCIGTMNDDLTA